MNRLAHCVDVRQAIVGRSRREGGRGGAGDAVEVLITNLRDEVGASWAGGSGGFEDESDAVTTGNSGRRHGGAEVRPRRRASTLTGCGAQGTKVLPRDHGIVRS